MLSATFFWRPGLVLLVMKQAPAVVQLAPPPCAVQLRTAPLLAPVISVAVVVLSVPTVGARLSTL